MEGVSAQASNHSFTQGKTIPPFFSCTWAFYTHHLQHDAARKLSIGWFHLTGLEQLETPRQKVKCGGGETGLF